MWQLRRGRVALHWGVPAFWPTAYNTPAFLTSLPAANQQNHSMRIVPDCKLTAVHSDACWLHGCPTHGQTGQTRCGDTRRRTAHGQAPPLLLSIHGTCKQVMPGLAPVAHS
jgi:hypothetical protein